MNELVKIAFASGSDDLNPCLIDELAALYPELPLLVVSEFPPHRGEWVPYHVRRTFRENMEAVRASVKGRRIRLAGVLLVPKMPYRRMRLMALVLSPLGFLAYNEHLGSFMLRPRSAPTIVRHIVWRTGNLIRWEAQPGALLYTWAWRIRHPYEARIPLIAIAARFAGRWFHVWRP